MAESIYGYREGVRRPVLMKMDSSSAAIYVGDMLSLASAGYVKAAAAGDKIVGVSMQNVPTISADGDASVLVDQSTDSIYEYPAGTGTLTQAMVGLTCDISGSQGLDVTASSDDCIYIRRVDLDRATAFVSMILVPSGVV